MRYKQENTVKEVDFLESDPRRAKLFNFATIGGWLVDSREPWCYSEKIPFQGLQRGIFIFTCKRTFYTYNSGIWLHDAGRLKSGEDGPPSRVVQRIQQGNAFIDIIAESFM